ACTAVARLYDVDLEIDAGRLALANGDKVRYIAGLLKARGVDIDKEQFAVFYGVYRANLLCYRAYSPQVLSRNIDVALYRATQNHHDRPDMPPDYGWDRLLRSPIRTHDVDADHLSILENVRFADVAGAFHPTTH